VLKIHFRNYHRNEWFSSITHGCGAHARGHVYYENRLYHGIDLCQLISKMTLSEIETEIKKFNGLFSFVKMNDTKLFWL